MTLIVEDGSGMSTAEAYVSVSDALAYGVKQGLDYLDNAQATGWLKDLAVAIAANPDDERVPAIEQAVRRATIYLDTLYYAQWAGICTSIDQALQWPRRGVVKARACAPYRTDQVYSLGPWYGTRGYGARGISPYFGVGLPGATYLDMYTLPPQLVLACVHVTIREYGNPGSLLPDYVASEAIQTESVERGLSVSYFDRGVGVSPIPRLTQIEAMLRPLIALGKNVVSVGRA